MFLKLKEQKFKKIKFKILRNIVCQIWDRVKLNMKGFKYLFAKIYATENTIKVTYLQKSIFMPTLIL